MEIEQADALQVIESMGTAYLKNAARYIEANHEGIEDGMEVIEWLGEALDERGAARLMTSLVSGSAALLNHAVDVYLKRR